MLWLEQKFLNMIESSRLVTEIFSGQNYFSNLIRETNPFETDDFYPLAGSLEKYTLQKVTLALREMKDMKIPGLERKWNYYFLHYKMF